MASAEVYDPKTDSWETVGSLNVARFRQAATLLQGGNCGPACGKVLVVGGSKVIDSGQRVALSSAEPALSSAELYDPATRTWSRTGALSTGRWNHSATLLATGGVLVAGGQLTHDGDHLGSSRKTVATAEIYDPASGTWATTASMAVARSGHTATRLGDGTVMVAGGWAESPVIGSGEGLKSREIYDPDQTPPRWRSAGELITAQVRHSATLLGGTGCSGANPATECGKVLIAGGGSPELYDPATGTSAPTTPPAHTRNGVYHRDGTATLLPSGTVVITGGECMCRSAEVFDPTSTASVSPPQIISVTPRSAQPTIKTSVVIDGDALDGATKVTFGGTEAEFTQVTNERIVAEAPPHAPGWADVVVTGKEGATSLRHRAARFLYSSLSGTWVAADPLRDERVGHVATALLDGRVLVAGGWTNSTEVYDPDADQWSRTDPLSVDRRGHTGTLLHDGRVLVVGGSESSGNTDLATAETYGPADGTWTTSTAVMSSPRTSHTATLLPSGHVLIVGGYYSFRGNYTYPTTVELYDPHTRLLVHDGAAA